jgi:hypothetical protein
LSSNKFLLEKSVKYVIITCIMTSSWTPERIEAQRQLAKRLVEEGKFGGAGRGQGRPRKPRASEKVAELVAGDGRRMYDRLMDILDNGTDSNSILAVREIRAIEENERKIVVEEDQASIDNMKKDQLLALVIGKIFELGDKGVIPNEIIEGEIVGITDERPSESSETVAGAIERSTG